MKKFFFLFCSLILTYASTSAQEQLKHEKKMWVSPEQKIFVNKLLPIYFKVSTSPDANAPAYTLPSEQTPKYANPMYFDTEGRNTLRSPSAVDPDTRKQIIPLTDIKFDVYADGSIPHTKIHLNGAEKFTKNGILYIGKNLKIDLAATDETSGVESSYLSVDKAVYTDYSKFQGAFDQEKEYAISVYSVDHVGNVESPVSAKFHTDLTAPTTTFKIIGEKKGNVLSAKASISLSSNDTLSGVKHIYYTINDGPEKVYAEPIPLSVLKDGKTQIHYFAVDNVGNKEESKVLATSTEGSGNESSTYSFYIDKEAPVMSVEIVGDQHVGKYSYMSERSRFKINASDEKSGVAQVMYSINNPLLKETYSEPFAIPGDGLHSIAYASTDNVGNAALPQTQQVYVDRSTPRSKVSYSGRQFWNRDTLFITKETRIVISTSEVGSGIKAVSYAFDGSPKEVYTTPLTVEKEGLHTFEFFAADNVNNTEDVQKCSFVVDNTCPEILCNFSVKAIGEKMVKDEKFPVYPSNTMLYIASTDNASGVERVEYSINGKEAQTVIPLKAFAPGNYEIQIKAYDMLKNMASKIIRFTIEN
jgi:hypothetical protein